MRKNGYPIKNSVPTRARPSRGKPIDYTVKLGDNIAIDKRGLTGLKGDSYVYFLTGRSTRLVKIGFSRDALKRIRDIAQGCAELLLVNAIILGTKEDERALHKRFAEHRNKGEWFSECQEMRDYIRGLHKLPDICVYSNPWNAITL